MSKGGSSDSPAATSFENPRKVGWLYKQGGSGVISHWRKRWFIADHHYLFYYKKPEDKSPVGILCLPEYDSCHKSDSKEWKKPNTFVLNKGNDADTTDGPSKSYVLHSDSDEDMQEWIKALVEEMKPMLDGNKYEGQTNGQKQVTPSKKKGEKTKAAVDPKAFNELSALASEGPKLTHLTTSRPKVRNRRPPKRYAVFHEDDDKEDESPPPSPITKPLPPPPSTSPSSQPKKGHRPSAPLMPNKSKPPTPVKPPKSDVGEIEAPTSAEVKQRPLPPKKPSKVHFEPSSPSTPLDQRKEQNTPPAPSAKPRPIPPSKPSKVNIETPELSSPPPAKKPRPQPPVKPRTSTVSIVPTEPQSPVTPVPRPRPVPRKRTMTSAENPAPVPIKEEAPKPEPVVEEGEKEKNEVTTQEQDIPQAVEEVQQENGEIVPAKNDSDDLPVETEEVPCKESSPSEEPQSLVTEEDSAEVDQDEEEGSESKPPGDKPDGISELAEEGSESKPLGDKPDGSSELAEEGSESKPLGDKPDGSSELAEEDVESKPPEVETEKDRELETIEVEEEKLESQSTPPKEDSEPVAMDDGEDSDNIYEDMDAGGREDSPLQSDSSKEGTPPDSAYEPFTFGPPKDTPPIRPPINRHSYDLVPTENFSSDTVEISIQEQPAASLVPQPIETVSKGESTSSSISLNSPGYEKMDPASPAIGEEPPSSDEYVAMEVGVFEEGTRTDSDWKCSPDGGNYDVPPRPRTASGQDTHGYDKASSVIAPGDSHMTELQVNDSPEGTRRSPSFLSSSGSTGSRKSPGSPGLPRKSSKSQTDFEKTPRSSKRKSSSTERDRSSSNSSSTGLRRDSHGYTKVKKVDSVIPTTTSFSSAAGTPPKVPPQIHPLENPIESSLDNVPGTLKQVREILRLSHVVKIEAEQMKEEAQRELELARRERHDAELLKRNAAQILKMAKERLHDAKSR